MTLEVYMPEALIPVVGAWFIALMIKTVLEFVPL